MALTRMGEKHQPDTKLLPDIRAEAEQLLGLERHANAYRVVAARSDDPWAHQALASVLATQGKSVEAEVAIREAIRLGPAEGGRHHDLAEVLRNQGKFAEAAAEYAEAIRLRPDELASYHSLGNVYAHIGEFEKASAIFAEAVERGANDHWFFFKWATLCSHTNNGEEYQRACRAMLERFGQSEHREIAERTAKACALAPDFGDDAQQVMRLADLAMTDTQAHPARKWFQTTRALVDYRAGRFEAASDMAVAADPSAEGVHRDALTFSILAMAQHRLGHVDKAVAALANARQIMSKKMHKFEDGEAFINDWHDWLHARVLFREAEKLLAEPASKP
jgi:tetratricopeptide (TPR) repeat protein